MIFQTIEILEILANIIGSILLFLKPIITPIGEWMVGWITTGMDLELWSSTLLDKARNKKIMDGEAGFVSASDGVPVLQKVEKGDLCIPY